MSFFEHLRSRGCGAVPEQAHPRGMRPPSGPATATASEFAGRSHGLESIRATASKHMGRGCSFHVSTTVSEWQQQRRVGLLAGVVPTMACE